MNMELILLKALQGTSSNHPCDLTSLIERIDALEKIVPTHAEINEGLRNLIQKGKVSAGPNGYSILPEPHVSPQSPVADVISRQAYEAAVRSYKGR